MGVEGFFWFWRNQATPITLGNVMSAAVDSGEPRLAQMKDSTHYCPSGRGLNFSHLFCRCRCARWGCNIYGQGQECCPPPPLLFPGTPNFSNILNVKHGGLQKYLSELSLAFHWMSIYRSVSRNSSTNVKHQR